jgi:hypothetical protein
MIGRYFVGLIGIVVAIGVMVGFEKVLDKWTQFSWWFAWLILVVVLAIVFATVIAPVLNAA